LDARFHDFHDLAVFNAIEPSMLLGALSFLRNELSLHDLSDRFVGNVTELVRTDKSVWNLLEGWVIHLLFNRIFIVLHLLLFQLDGDTLVDYWLKLLFGIKTKLTKGVLPRPISISECRVLHYIFKVSDCELVLQVILIKRVIQRVLKPTWSFFHVCGNQLEKISLWDEFWYLRVRRLGNLVFVVDTLGHYMGRFVYFRFDFVGEHAKRYWKNYSHRGGTKL